MKIFVIPRGILPLYVVLESVIWSSSFSRVTMVITTVIIISIAIRSVARKPVAIEIPFEGAAVSFEPLR